MAKELTHARVYDPVKAREYYLRTRELKGRKPRQAVATTGSRQPAQGMPMRSPAKGTSNTNLRDSRRKELEARKANLEAKLDRLQALYRERIAAAKKRSGIKTADIEEATPSSKSTTEKGSKAKGKSDSKDKPLTESQKREKREASREQYAKENKTSLAVEVQQLEAQIRDMQSKLQAVAAKARKKAEIRSTPQTRYQSTTQTAVNRR